MLDAPPTGVSVHGPDDNLRFVDHAYGKLMAGASRALGERREEIVRPSHPALVRPTSPLVDPEVTP